MPKLGELLRKPINRETYLYWCPGCGHAHEYVCEPPRGWTFDGNVEQPTFTPSMRVFFPGATAHDDKPARPERTLCHHFVTKGQIQYLSDCVHALAGQTVPMVPVSDHADYGWGDS